MPQTYRIVLAALYFETQVLLGQVPEAPWLQLPAVGPPSTHVRSIPRRVADHLSGVLKHDSLKHNRTHKHTSEDADHLDEHHRGVLISTRETQKRNTRNSKTHLEVIVQSMTH